MDKRIGYIGKKCEVCGNNFKTRKKKAKGSTKIPLGFRRITSKTCSKICSKEYTQSEYLRKNRKANNG